MRKTAKQMKVGGLQPTSSLTVTDKLGDARRDSSAKGVDMSALPFIPRLLVPSPDRIALKSMVTRPIPISNAELQMTASRGKSVVYSNYMPTN
jgi:hypothetical protein